MFKRKGYEWDVGIHYIGEVHRDSSTGRRIFDLITDGNLKWAGMGNPYDESFFLIDRTISVHQSKCLLIV